MEETFNKYRIIREQSELSDKIIKLELFIQSESYPRIESIQKSLLQIQLFSMKSYSQCLVERLSYLK